MRTFTKLLDVDRIILNTNNCSLVVIEITVVGSGEHGNESRAFLLPEPLIHLEPISLCLMSSDNGQQAVGLIKLFGQCLTKKVRAPSTIVHLHQSIKITLAIINRISPHQVTKRPFPGNLPEPLNPRNIVEGLDIRGDATMNAQKAPIDQTCQRQGIEQLHDQVIDILIVLFQAYLPVSVHSCRKLKWEVSCLHS